MCVLQLWDDPSKEDVKAFTEKTLSGCKWVSALCQEPTTEGILVCAAAGGRPEQGGREGVHREDPVQRQGGARLRARRVAQNGALRLLQVSICG